MIDKPDNIINLIIDINQLINDSTNTVIDTNRLQSIVSAYHYYDSKLLQLCAIFKSIIKNHAFIDGNKRTALYTLLIFANENNFLIKVNDDLMFETIQNIAANDLDIETICKIIF